MTSELQSVLVYLTGFFMVFLSFVVFSLCLRVLLWIYMQYYNHRRSDEGSDMHLPHGHRCSVQIDRQGNIFTIADETSHGNSTQHRCPDFFYVEPSAADDAARIRAQLEKDEKDLPTYEEVMAMSVAQAQAGSLAPQTATSNTSIAVTRTATLADQTYPEVSNMAAVQSVQPQAAIIEVTQTANAQAIHNGVTVWPPKTATGSAVASTSNAAGTNTPSSTVAIANSASNTSV